MTVPLVCGGRIVCDIVAGRYRDVKRDVHEGEAKFNRMQTEAQLHESAKARGDYLGAGSLTDYHSGFELGLGWHDSPYHYNSHQMSARFAEKKAMEALLPEFRSSMDLMKSIKLQREVEAKQKDYEDNYNASWLDSRIGAAAHHGREDFKHFCLMSPLSVLNTADNAQVLRKNEVRQQEVERVRRQHAVEIEARAKRDAQVEEESQMKKLQRQLEVARESIVKERQSAKESTTAARRSLHESAAQEAEESLPRLQKQYDLLAHQYAMDDMAARSIEDAAKRAEYTPVTYDSLIGHRHLQSMPGLDSATSFLIDLEALEKDATRFEINIDADKDGSLTREEFMQAYTKDIQLFNALAGLAAKVVALQRKIDHSLALAHVVTTDTNLDNLHNVSRRCTALLDRLAALRSGPSS